MGEYLSWLQVCGRIRVVGRTYGANAGSDGGGIGRRRRRARVARGGGRCESWSRSGIRRLDDGGGSRVACQKVIQMGIDPLPKTLLLNLLPTIVEGGWVRTEIKPCPPHPLSLVGYAVAPDGYEQS